MSPRQGERVKIPLFPNNVGKKSGNDAGPKQGHDKILSTFSLAELSNVFSMLILQLNLCC